MNDFLRTLLLFAVFYDGNEFCATAFRKTQMLMDATSVSRVASSSLIKKVLLAATMIDVCPRYTLYVHKEFEAKSRLACEGVIRNLRDGSIRAAISEKIGFE